MSGSRQEMMVTINTSMVLIKMEGKPSLRICSGGVIDKS